MPHCHTPSTGYSGACTSPDHLPVLYGRGPNRDGRPRLDSAPRNPPSSHGGRAPGSAPASGRSKKPSTASTTGSRVIGDAVARPLRPPSPVVAREVLVTATGYIPLSRQSLV